MSSVTSLVGRLLFLLLLRSVSYFDFMMLDHVLIFSLSLHGPSQINDLFILLLLRAGLLRGLVRCRCEVLLPLVVEAIELLF
mmetsp:Transcript_20847/g.32166  ORF Transcript_20847/g.32166 Transcript_20847/m.32166 type:complete len:82 (+) Transcript_20847:973-1218(+)